jgi:hypothetical protein
VQLLPTFFFSMCSDKWYVPIYIIQLSVNMHGGKTSTKICSLTLISQVTGGLISMLSLAIADLHLFCACCSIQTEHCNRLCFSRNRKLITLAYCTLRMARNRSSGDCSVLMIHHFPIISVDISAVNI